MTQAITRYDGGEMDTMQLGQMLAKSGYFSDVREAAQAVVKVLAGREMGIGPIAAMTGIYIVKGRVTLSANLMAAQIKRSGKYTYNIADMTNERCELVYYDIHGDKATEIGRSTFTKEDAQQAGLWGSSEPWKKTPRNMLFARAMSNGAKWFCPDVFSGPIYTPDELMDGQEATYEPPPSPARTEYVPAPPVNRTTGEVVDAPRNPTDAPVCDVCGTTARPSKRGEGYYCPNKDAHGGKWYTVAIPDNDLFPESAAVDASWAAEYDQVEG